MINDLDSKRDIFYRNILKYIIIFVFVNTNLKYFKNNKY